MLLWSKLKRILKKEGWEFTYGIYSNNGDKVLFYENGPNICEVEKRSFQVVYTMIYSKSGEQYSHHNYITGETWYSEEVKKNAEEYFKKHKKYKRIL